ncbi:MAG: hypothetical protein DRI36_02580 [Caldiserica bacterium]|nr:MAG: hypothetical protein DRI36_02580 [Caldisericota bacterium]
MRRGLTYIEIILGVAIISYLFLSFVQVMMNISILTKQDELKDIACGVAINSMEEIKVLPYSQIENFSDDIEIEGRVFKLKCEVKEKILNYLKLVKVSVFWKEKGEVKSFSLVTYRANYR